MSINLEFEKPIAELEEKIAELRKFSSAHNVDVSHGIKLLEEQVAETKQKVFANLSSWQRVQLARHPERPHSQDYIQLLFTDFMEFHGDRRFADDRAIVGGFAKLDDTAVMIIGTRKGRDLKENMAVNFGSAHPEGYRKALRLMRMADKARVPVVVLIDTPGAYPGLGAEERHIGEAIAVNLREMFTLKIPVLAVVIGEGGSGGALGIGVGNRVLISENAYYSVITPEGCAAILWRDSAAAPKAAEALKLTSADLKALNIVDEVIPEPLGGAHRDPERAAEFLKEALLRNLSELEGLSASELCAQRYEKYRTIGIFQGE